MAAGSRDRPPMLAPGRYPQWRLRFLRYVVTRPNGEALRKCMLSGPYKPTTILVQAVEVTDNSLAVPEHTTVETPTNMSLENKPHFLAENEAIHLILTGIRDDIYSTIDACQTAQEISSVPSPKPSITSRSQTTTRHKGKEIAKPITPPSETTSKEDIDPKQAQRDKDTQKNLGLIAKYFKKIYKPSNNNLRTSSNSKNKNVDMTLRKLKRVKDSTYHKEKMLLCKQAEQGAPLQAEQYDWLADTDEEVDEQELGAHYSYMAKIRETKQTEFEKYKEFNDRTVDYDILEHKLNEALGQLAHKDIVIRERLKTKAYELSVVKEKYDKLMKHSLLTKSHYEGLVKQIMKDMEILIQTCLMPLAIKTQSDNLKFVHELKQEMHTNLKYVESLEKEIDELESEKAEFSDMYDVILQDYVSKDVMCSYLQSLSDLDALAELQCMYLHKVKECDCLAQKLSNQTDSVSKEVHTELLTRFVKLEKHFVSLELSLQKRKEQAKNDTVWNEKASNGFRKEREQYIEIQDFKAKLQDKNIAIILGKPTPFSDSLERKYFPKTRSVPKTNVSEGLSKPVTAQTLPQAAMKAVRVNHNTNVSRPPLKRNQSKDNVLPNNSQVKVKKTQVEVHPRISSVSNKMKSVTACKDSLNSRTLNANVVCTTCNKCLVDFNHFACVTKMLKDVHARTKKPTIVPISSRKPISQANK
nr:hypothetical protein [Tanacetum cinerariifolium]